MKLGRCFPVMGMELRKVVREPSAMFMALLFPIVLTLAFGVSFGGAGGGGASYSVGVIDLDHSGWSQNLQANLTATKILTLNQYNNLEAASQDMRQGKLDALLVIPSGFGIASQSYVDHPNEPGSWDQAQVQIYLDQASLFATQAIQPLVAKTMDDMLAPSASVPTLPVTLSEPQFVGTDQTSAFDVIAPGMFAFASIFLIMIVAGSFTGARESGQLKRLNVTPLTAGEFIMANIGANMAIAAAQTALVFVMAVVMGWNPGGGIEAFLFGVLILLVFSVCNVGFGLIAATMAKTQSAATGMAFIFVIPQMFLGTFVGSMLGGAIAQLQKFVPAYYVTDALTSVFVRGAAVTSYAVMMDFAVVMISSLLVVAAGILLFRRYGSR